MKSGGDNKIMKLKLILDKNERINISQNENDMYVTASLVNVEQTQNCAKIHHVEDKASKQVLLTDIIHYLDDKALEEDFGKYQIDELINQFCLDNQWSIILLRTNCQGGAVFDVVDYFIDGIYEFRGKGLNIDKFTELLKSSIKQQDNGINC